MAFHQSRAWYAAAFELFLDMLSRSWRYLEAIDHSGQR